MSAADRIGYLLTNAGLWLSPSARVHFQRSFDSITDVLDIIIAGADVLRPPMRLRLHVGPFLDPRTYHDSAQRNIRAFQDLAGLTSTSRVLDLGCGYGRIAAPLARLIVPPGYYEGIDAASGPVDWCRTRISTRYPCIRFKASDNYSQRYNPSGATPAASYRLPYADRSFDIVLATSFYTHLLPGEMVNYVRETARVLRSGGMSVATLCLLNATTRLAIANGASDPPLPYEYGSCRIRDPKDPASFIAFPEDLIRDTYERAGLHILDPVRYGAWSSTVREKEERSQYGFSQDLIVASLR